MGRHPRPIPAASSFMLCRPMGKDTESTRPPSMTRTVPGCASCRKSITVQNGFVWKCWVYSQWNSQIWNFRPRLVRVLLVFIYIKPANQGEKDVGQFSSSEQEGERERERVRGRTECAKLKWVCLKIVYLIFQWIITMFPIKIAMNVGIPYFQTNPNRFNHLNPQRCFE